MLNRSIAFGAVLFIVAASALGQTTSTNTITYTTTSNLPPVGLAPSETAQVILVNMANAPATASATATPAPCTGSVAFFNASGTQIGTGTFSLAAGKIFSVPLPGSSLASRTIIRAQIVTTVTVTDTVIVTDPVTGVAIPAGPSVTAIFAPPSCTLGSSLEIFDTTSGALHAFIPGGSSAVPVPAIAVRTGDFTSTLPTPQN
jgi:hypothetical protein